MPQNVMDSLVLEWNKWHYLYIVVHPNIADGHKEHWPSYIIAGSAWIIYY